MSRTARRVARATPLLLLCALAACKQVAERALTRPTIAVRGVKVRSVGLDGGALEVTLAIANPNPFPLPVKRATYLFQLADSTEIGRGESATAFTIPASDSALVNLPLDVSWRGLRAASRDAARDGAVDYRFSGIVTLDTPLGDPNVSFASAGRFTPPPAMRSLP